MKPHIRRVSNPRPRSKGAIWQCGLADLHCGRLGFYGYVETGYDVREAYLNFATRHQGLSQIEWPRVGRSKP